LLSLPPGKRESPPSGPSGRNRWTGSNLLVGLSPISFPLDSLTCLSTPQLPFLLAMVSSSQRNRVITSATAATNQWILRRISTDLVRKAAQGSESGTQGAASSDRVQNRPDNPTNSAKSQLSEQLATRT